MKWMIFLKIPFRNKQLLDANLFIFNSYDIIFVWVEIFYSKRRKRNYVFMLLILVILWCIQFQIHISFEALLFD